VFDAASADAVLDAFGADEPPVLVVVVAAVGVQAVGSAAGPADTAAYRRHLVKQGYELGDVVAVAAGQRHRQQGVPWPSVSTWCFEPGRARSTGLGPVFGPPLSARTWELSITARDQSSFPAACNSASLRQQVMPDPKPSSLGRNSHRIPVCSTNKIPHSTFRSSNRLRPG